MGLSCSTFKGIESNEYLQRFCGPETVTQYDPVWNNLFSHSLNPLFTKDDYMLLDGHSENLRNQFVINNLTTRNLSALIDVFISRAKELSLSVQTVDSIFIWQTCNALSLIKHLCRYLIENVSDEEFNNHFKPVVVKNGNAEGPVIDGDIDTLELLLESSVKIITEIPVTSLTYVLHLETVNLLVTLMSGQMYWPVPAAKLAPFRVIMLGTPSILAPMITKALLQNYIDQMVPPDPLFQRQDDESGSIVIGMASGFWNILRSSVGLGNSDDRTISEYKRHNLASQSLNLLLILTNHCTCLGEDSLNIYQHALITLGNDAGVQNEDALAAPAGEELSLFKLNYSKLYEVICTKIDQDETTLLLYTLVHRNSGFKSYIMARSDIEQLVLPMLKTLYNAPTSASHHIYMSLIIMLILSEDALFNQQVHDILLKNITWYTERNLTEISLGGIIILVIIRTIQYNILKMRDKYLHTNCLAALANMSSKFRSLHPYVTQRLISLFETLAKRHSKLLKKLEESPGDGSRTDEEQASEMVQDINVLEEVIRMVLEILNSTLSNQLAHNIHLIYTLLYKKHVFDAYRHYDASQDLVYNLDLVINYFTKRLGDEAKDLSVSEVMDRIQDGVLHWSPEILRKFGDLKFRYVEEDQPENFFIPYVWSLVYKRSGLYWSPINLSIFGSENEYMV
ncbi:unnamed protein product [Orchesella dallaii]|uniref:Dymeclin n=1 Tax=Orchesella dallaii TaxID=48710 RepID=A0ABP1R4P0_9HEXA